MEGTTHILQIIENESVSERERIENIYKLGDNKHYDAIPILIQMLIADNSIYVRNAIATSLANLNADEAVPIIMELIKKPENSNNHGPLILSVGDLDFKQHFIYFINLLCTAVFEVRQMCEFIVEKYANEVSQSEKKEALSILNKHKKQLKSDKDEISNRIAFINASEKLLKTKK